MGAKLQSSSRATRASTRRLPPPKQAGIQAFTRATKSGATLSDAKDASSSRKRKAEEVEISIVSSSNGGQESCEDYTRTTARATKAAKLSGTATRLSTSHSSPASLTTPSKSLTPSTSTTPSEQPPSDDNDNGDDDDTDDRPQSFYDLTNLHSSFLTALSLHYSHNGRNTPADLNQLLPSTERIWKKRKVEKEDIQRVLYILDNGSDKGSGVSFRIANYGIGKTCLEIVGANRSGKQFGPPFDEAELIVRFSRNLEETWRQSVVGSSGSNQQSPDFARNIPLVPIHDSTNAFTSLRIGQQRLLDLKKGIVGLKTAGLETQHGERPASARGSNGTAGRRSGLLQRIQNKQLRQTTLAPPLSKEAILRQSAANLVEDVIGILILMRPSSTSPLISSGFVSSKKPYKFDTIVQNIRDSLRSAISKQEIEACLDLLAQPSVAGDWIDIITVNRLKSVVLKSGRDISPQEICMKVAHIKA
ncbi:hypothetical protein FQN53_003214 [Emmonsiellopsis sp. PD_33]|nr:hypothetical protein FQN53_003214 [Emmonsiellopsis sp. PD_33]